MPLVQLISGELEEVFLFFKGENKMSYWSPFIGVVLLAYAAFVIYRGRLTSTDDYKRSSWITRSEQPLQFWFSVFVILVMAVLLLFNVFHF